MIFGSRVRSRFFQVGRGRKWRFGIFPLEALGCGILFAEGPVVVGDGFVVAEGRDVGREEFAGGFHVNIFRNLYKWIRCVV